MDTRPCFFCKTELPVEQMTLCTICREGFCINCPDHCGCSVDAPIAAIENDLVKSFSRSVGAKVGPWLCGILVGVSILGVNHLMHLATRTWPYHNALSFTVDFLTVMVVVPFILKVRRVAVAEKEYRVVYPAYVGYIAGDLLRVEPRVRNRFAPLPVPPASAGLRDSYRPMPD